MIGKTKSHLQLFGKISSRSPRSRTRVDPIATRPISDLFPTSKLLDLYTTSTRLLELFQVIGWNSRPCTTDQDPLADRARSNRTSCPTEEDLYSTTWSSLIGVHRGTSGYTDRKCERTIRQIRSTIRIHMQKLLICLYWCIDNLLHLNRINRPDMSKA